MKTNLEGDFLNISQMQKKVYLIIINKTLKGNIFNEKIFSKMHNNVNQDFTEYEFKITI